MGLVYKAIIILAQLAKTFCPFLALIYMICWGFLIGNPELFDKWDAFLNPFPNFLNDIFQIQYDIDGRDIDMGYVLAAAFTFISMFILNQFQNFVEYTLLIHREKVVEETKERLKVQKVIAQMEEKKEEFVQLKTFWGMLEIEVSKNEIYDDKINNSELLMQYLKTLESKLKDKYPNMKLVKNRICVQLNSFEMFKNYICDTVELLKLLREISDKKAYKFSYILSFFSSQNEQQNKKAFSILNKINNLKMKNKVIVTKDIRNFCFKKNVFEFIAIGSSLLFAQGQNDEDITIELHQIKSLN